MPRLPSRVDDPLAAKIRHTLKKRGIDFDSSEFSSPAAEADSMKATIVNTASGIFIPCVSSYEKPVVPIMSYEASRQGKAQENDVMAEAARLANSQEPKAAESVDTPASSTMRYRTIPVYGKVLGARLMARLRSGRFWERDLRVHSALAFSQVLLVPLERRRDR